MLSQHCSSHWLPVVPTGAKMVLVTLTVCVCIVAVAVILCLYIRWKIAYRVWSRVGVKGPQPLLYYGNTTQITEKGAIKFIDQNLKVFGNVFGYYMGVRPYVIVKDLDMLRQIMVKHFDNFMDRSNSSSIVGVKFLKGQSVFRSKGSDWKRQRKILSKSFSAVKLNMMAPLVEGSCVSLVSKMEEHAKEGISFDLFRLYGRYTLEVILVAGFGYRVDVINGQDDELTRAAGLVFANTRKGNIEFLTTLFSNFPFLERLAKPVMSGTKIAETIRYFHKRAQELLENRLQDGSDEYQDMLQLLIDAKADSDDEDIKGAGHPNRLTRDEIILNTFAFLLAGYETTSNTLTYTSYLLALNPQEQEKIFDEIDQYFNSNPDASLLEASHSLKHIDMVIQESLRIYPPAYIVDRHVLKDTTINGQLFPKDSVIVVPIMAIHHSPDIWPEPSLFKPERFTKEEKEKRHQMAHMPFGWGPRSCIGMRLALMEAKMALIAIMKEYKFIEAPDTEKPLKTSLGITMVPTNGVYLMVEKRERR